jgi:LPXTG-motif cell wall-anchored protein
VRATGTVSILGIVTPGLTCPATELHPEHGHPAEMTCTHVHTVTADEIAADGATLRFAATGSAFGAVPVQAATSLSFQLAHESLVVKVVELSAPRTPSGYVPGEVVRLLVSVTNDGTLPIDVNSVTLPGSSATRASRTTRAFNSATGSCGQSVRLEPLASFDCSVDYAVVVADGIARTIELPFLVTTSAGLETNLTVTVRASTVGLQLPATGSDPRSLLVFGTALIAVGTLVRRFGQRSVNRPAPSA